MVNQSSSFVSFVFGNREREIAEALSAAYSPNETMCPGAAAGCTTRARHPADGCRGPG